MSEKKIDKEEIIGSFIEFLVQKYNITPKDIIRSIEKKITEIPLSIFDNDALSALETIVKYLHENKKLTFSKIAELLNRDQRAIWRTYNFAKKKLEKRFIVKLDTEYIPIDIFKDRSFSVLEILVLYLKDTLNLSFHQIAIALHRDDSTIWTTYNRALKKRKKIAKP